jgi:hypothetical protein
LHSISVPALVRPRAPVGEQYAPGCTPASIDGFGFGFGAAFVVVVALGLGFGFDVAFGVDFVAVGVWVAVVEAVAVGVTLVGELDVVDGVLTGVAAAVVVVLLGLDVAAGPVRPAGVPSVSCVPPSIALPITPTSTSTPRPVRILCRRNQDRLCAGCTSSSHSCQPAGGGPHAASGCQPSGGVQPAGGGGQFGGGLNRAATSTSFSGEVGSLHPERQTRQAFERIGRRTGTDRRRTRNAPPQVRASAGCTRRTG